VSLGIIAFTQKGRKLACKILTHTSGKLYTKGTIPSSSKDDFSEIWLKHSEIIFIGATGIAVRYIAPHLVKKDQDPAVLCIDDQGKFVISLLSGHLGGANNLAQVISNMIGATPVITTASDGRGFTAIDLIAKGYNLYIEDLASITPITTLMVDGEEIGYYSTVSIPMDYPRLKTFSRPREIQNVKGALLISEELIDLEIPHAILRPKNLNVGIGARRGVFSEKIYDLLLKTFEEQNLSVHSIKAIGSIDVKADEEGIIKLADKLNVPYRTFAKSELEPYESQCRGSDFVKKTVGVSSVSCTSALKLGGQLILDKNAQDGITISITKEN